VLGARKRNRRWANVRKKKALKDLDNRREKRDWAIRGAKVKRLAWFGDGDDVGSFPDSGKVSRINRKVKEFVKIRDAARAKVFEMKRGQTVWAGGSRITGLLDGIRS